MKTEIMKQQTAVDYLLSRLSAMGLIEDIDDPLVEQIRNEARQMEKEQLNRAWFDSTAQFDNAVYMPYAKEFEEYYSETYEQK